MREVVRELREKLSDLQIRYDETQETNSELVTRLNSLLELPASNHPDQPHLDHVLEVDQGLELDQPQLKDLQ